MVLWNLKCPVGLTQKEICAHFSEGNLTQFGRSAKINTVFVIYWAESSSVLFIFIFVLIYPLKVHLLDTPLLSGLFVWKLVGFSLLAVNEREEGVGPIFVFIS